MPNPQHSPLPTARQKEVLTLLKRECAKYGRFPTFQKIADHFGWYRSSPACHLLALTKKGYLKRDEKGKLALTNKS